LFQLLDLGPEALVGGERFLKGSALKTALLDRSHNTFRLPTDVDQLTVPRGDLRVLVAR